MLDLKLVLARGAVAFALVLTAPLATKAQETDAAAEPAADAQLTDLQLELQGISQRIADLTLGIDDELKTEHDAERIYTEQTEIIRAVLNQISPDGDFGGQVQDIQARAERNLAVVNTHPNPAMQAIAPRFQGQIDEAVRIRTATGVERSRGLKAIRQLDDEQEVAVMLIRAGALDAAIEQAKQRLEAVRELADKATALAEEVRVLQEAVSD